MTVYSFTDFYTEWFSVPIRPQSIAQRPFLNTSANKVMIKKLVGMFRISFKSNGS
jgi:hypothetical protein